GRESTQVAGRVFRLFHLLRARSTAAGARDVHESELPADRGRRTGEELSRLGHPARPPHARAEAVVRDPRAGCQRFAGPHPARPRERTLAARRDRARAAVAAAGAPAAADTGGAARAAWAGRR